MDGRYNVVSEVG